MFVNRRQLFVFFGLIMAILALTACGGASAQPTSAGSVADTGGAGEEASSGPEPTPVPTLGVEGVEGKFYSGEIVPPQGGFGAMHIYQDGQIEMLLVMEGDPNASLWMTGTLEGQRVNLEAEVGGGRAIGRSVADETGFDLNVTVPGQGFMRIVVEADGGALYTGELNGLTAALMVLPDGTINGIAAVQGGDEPVFELLCVDGVEGLPKTITATTCDSGEEVTLTQIID